MTIELPLDRMSSREKLDLMETLWEDLTKCPEELPIPEWHREVLAECERQVEAGEAKFTVWEVAMGELRQKLTSNLPVWQNPNRMSGAVCFLNTRVPISSLFENLESGASLDEFLDDFEGVTREQAVAVLEHARRSLLRVSA